MELYAQNIAQSSGIERQTEERPQPFAGHDRRTGKAAAGNSGKPQEFEESRNRRPGMDFQDTERNHRRREAGEKPGAGGIDHTTGRTGSESDGAGGQVSQIRQLMEKIMLQLEAWKERIDLETIRSKSHDNRTDDKEDKHYRQKTQAPHP